MSDHRIRIIPTGRMDGRSYLVICPQTREAALIDPDMNSAALLAAIHEEGVQVKAIVLTHCHYDHISSSDLMREKTGAPVAIHRIDAPGLADPRMNMSVMDTERIYGRQVDRLLEEGDRLMVGAFAMDVLLTPGHTPGGICLRVGDDLFSGDTLFRGSYGNPGFPGGNLAALRQSCLRLFELPDDVQVFPGHGGPTSIGDEKHTNPILR